MTGMGREFCKTCHHDKANHDTGWDASGCMVKGCACNRTHSSDFAPWLRAPAEKEEE